MVTTAGMIAGYHLTVLLEDRKAIPDMVEPTLMRATVVGSTTDPIVDAIRSDIGAVVTVIDTVPQPVTANGVEDALKALKATHNQAVVVVADGAGGYRIMQVKE